MDANRLYRIKAAQYRLLAQTENDPTVRAALRDLENDYLRLLERPGDEIALTVEFEPHEKPHSIN